VQSDLPREHDMALLNPTSDYFSVLGIPLLRGRTFGPGDGTREPGVAILNASAARHLFGSLDVAGRTLPVSRTGVPVTIVGVVGDVKYAGLDQRAEDTVYVPFPQYPFRNMMLVARTAGDVDALARSLGAAVHRVDPAITIGRVQTLDEVVRAAVARPRFRTALFASLAGLALVLAAVGLFGVAAYAVTERTKEIGIRMALGAGRRQVVGMIVRDTLRLATAGTAIGVIAALFFTRALAAFVYGVTTRDLPSFVLAAAGLVAVSVAASYTAARRAANVDPATLLHAE
jgi:putative ABC transport system permease protein